MIAGKDTQTHINHEFEANIIPSSRGRDKEMFSPIRRDKDLIRVQPRTDLHPLLVLWVHAAQALRVPESRRHVLAKMTSIRRAVLVEVFEIRTEEDCWVETLGEAPFLCVVLEEVDV